MQTQVCFSSTQKTLGALVRRNYTNAPSVFCMVCTNSNPIAYATAHHARQPHYYAYHHAQQTPT